MSEKKRVFAVLVDVKSPGRVGVNMKDSTEEDWTFEGRIGLFGGEMEPNETTREALERHLARAVPGFLADEDLVKAQIVHDDAMGCVYAVPTDLSGDSKTRDRDRIGALASCCREGDGVVRRIEFVRNRMRSWFLHPFFPRCIDLAFRAFSGEGPPSPEVGGIEI